MNVFNFREIPPPAAKPLADAALPLRSILPGMLLILAIDLWALIGNPKELVFFRGWWILLIAALPWLTLLVVRGRPEKLGYRRERAAVRFGWGAFFGALWRGLSMALNLFFVRKTISLGIDVRSIFNAFIFVPFIEETFFRGYLGRPLSHHLGRWKGIVLQALLFTFHPAHFEQGALAWISIFGFGLLAGWLLEKTGSIWTAWGAHACANVVPLLLASTF